MRFVSSPLAVRHGGGPKQRATSYGVDEWSIVAKEVKSMNAKFAAAEDFKVPVAVADTPCRNRKEFGCLCDRVTCKYVRDVAPKTDLDLT